MRYAILLLAALGACRAIARSETKPDRASTRGATAAIWVDTASMPASCRVHGGLPPRPSTGPIWDRGRRVVPGLDSLGQLWLRLYLVRTGEPFGGGMMLEPYPRRVGRIERVNAIWIRAEVPAGRYLLRLRGLNTLEWRDSIDVRRGYADTLTIGVGNPWLCFL